MNLFSFGDLPFRRFEDCETVSPPGTSIKTKQQREPPRASIVAISGAKGAQVGRWILFSNRVVYTTHYMPRFGAYIRLRRESLREEDAEYSVRKVATRIGIEPSYLSKVERDIEAAPSEPRIRALAQELGEDPDYLLALAGKVSLDVQKAIRRRPKLLSRLVRELNHLPDAKVRRVVRKIQGGQI